MEKFEEKAKKFKILNDMAIKGENVVFGSDYLYDFPFYTLMQKRVTDYAVYNRSIEGLKVKQAKSLVEKCLKNLDPSNILVSFGDGETIDDAFYSDYQALIIEIKRLYPTAQICILEPCNLTEENDNRLKTLAEKTNVKFIPVAKENNTERTIFGEISSFFRHGKISFADAFAI